MDDYTNTDKEQEKKEERGWMLTLGGAIAIGLVIVLAYGASSETQGIGPMSLVVAGACLMIGGLLGFLFGIPRTLQDGSAEGADRPQGEVDDGSPPRVRYKVNTNLEQISDWLTKILVGLGLTQLGKIPGELQELATYLAPIFGGTEAGSRFAAAMVLYFLTVGFLFGYLWTRLFLAGAFARADLGLMFRRVEKRVESTFAKKSEVDARALAMTYRYLDDDADSQDIEIEELKKAIRQASAGVKVQIFYQASRTRAGNWRDPAKKPLMARTIPIFEALIESDTELRFHKNHGQLGFALKDQQTPDWAGAEKALTKAIEIRGDYEKEYWSIYEFNRAVCRIHNDPAFQAKTASSADTRKAILADLRAAAHDDWLLRIILGDEPTRSWLEINGLDRKDLLT